MQIVSRRLVSILAVAAIVACDEAVPPGPGPGPGGHIVGTWGGEEAGLIASDSGAHLHLGCTYGFTDGPIVLDLAGRFDAPGVHNIDAHPVDRGIFHPARLFGVVHGKDLWVTVALTDTAVVLGPVHLRFGIEPGFAVCPICRSDRRWMEGRTMSFPP